MKRIERKKIKHKELPLHKQKSLNKYHKMEGAGDSPSKKLNLKMYNACS
jgi:hypothetical protein